jgi:hypothetical protein
MFVFRGALQTDRDDHGQVFLYSDELHVLCMSVGAIRVKVLSNYAIILNQAHMPSAVHV